MNISMRQIVKKILPPHMRSQVGKARTQISKVGRLFAPPSPEYPSIETALTDLKKRGFNPAFAVDIGAYVGAWTTSFKLIYPNSHVLMLEAQEKKREHLQAVCDKFGSSVDFQLALLGPVSGRKVAFIEMETGSSVFEEQSYFERDKVEKTIVSLDDLLKNETKPVDLLKLDVQGFELEVLRGASHALTQAQIVLMETSFINTNSGAPSFAEVIHFMDEKGFRVIDFCSQIRRRDGVLWCTDLLFVAKSSPLVPDAQLTKENW